MKIITEKEFRKLDNIQKAKFLKEIAQGKARIRRD